MKKQFLSIFLLCTAIPLFSQGFYGKAYYQSESLLEVSFKPPPNTDKDSIHATDKKVSMATAEEKALNDKIRKSMQKEFELLFNKSESLYREVQKLSDINQERGVEVIGLGGGTEGGLYKDTKNGKLLENRDVFGKLFLIDDQLKKLDWKLEKETKTIGAYTCHKATAIMESKAVKLEKRDGEMQKVETPIQRSITAWYTPQIPINQGPAEYWGLPGFILEADNGKLRITCTGIVLNPEEEVNIKVPSNGKKVDKATFKEMYNKKVLEMANRYENKRKKEKS